MTTPPTDDLRARLPELPEPSARYHVQNFRQSPEMRNTELVEREDFAQGSHSLFTADQMHDYAIAALSALPAGGGEDALLRMFRALVDAGGPETIARHGVERGSDAWASSVRTGMLAIERRFYPERFALDEPITTPPLDAAVPSDDELPGMWSGADLIGGKSDAEGPRDGSALMDVALMLWHRFAAEHVERWEDEPEKAIYTLAADAIIRRIATPDAAVGAQGEEWPHGVALHEVACDLPYLFGRASMEGHEAGQRLAREVQAKMRKALAAPAAGKGVDDAMVESLRELADELENAQASSHLGSLHAAGVVAGCRSAADRIRTLIGGQP